MRKVDTWLESTREYALKKQKEAFNYCIPQQNNKTKGTRPLSYNRHKDRHPVRPFLVQTIHALVNSSCQLLMQVCGWNVNQSSVWTSCYRAVYEKRLELRHSHPPRASFETMFAFCK